MNLVEAAQKCSVDDGTFEEFKQELQRVYLNELDQERGDRVRFRTLLAALKESGRSDLDYAKLLRRAVIDEWIGSTDELEPKRREVWLLEDGGRPWSQIKAEEEPSTNAQKAYHVLHELQPILEVIAIRDNGDLYTYDDGVWEPLGEQFLRETLMG
ncbi:MAG: hypothetical protein ABEH81_13465 [Halopenitus sp.]